MPEFECTFCHQPFEEKDLTKVQLSLWSKKPQESATTENLLAADTRLCVDCLDFLRGKLPFSIQIIAESRKWVVIPASYEPGNSPSFPPV